MSDGVDSIKRIPPLAELFSPRGVAVVGASASDKESFPNEAIRSLKRSGFPAIYPVNPKYTEMHGLPCYPNLQSIPGVVDHVVVSIPADSLLALLYDCARKGVKSVHIFTAGFSESGDTGRADLEKAMLSRAREGGFRIIGPNCTGMLVPKSRLIIRDVVPAEPGPIGFFSQSGGYADDFPLFGGPRGLRFSKLVSYGNALDVGESELLEYLTQDPDTEIITAYIEGVREGRRFLDALKKATARKPVVIQKGGRTEAGQRAAHGHTASLTSSVAVFNTVCRQFNAIQADDMEELINIAVALRFIKPLPLGGGAAIIGTGGGPSVLASDEIEQAGLHMPPFSAEVQTKLKQFLPMAGGIFINPVDSSRLTSPEAIYETLRILGKLPEIHFLIYHIGFHPTSRWGNGRLSTPAFLENAIDAFKQAQKETGKPVILALRPAIDLDGMKEFLAAQEAFVNGGFPVFHSLHQMAKTIATILAWKKSRQLHSPG